MKCITALSYLSNDICVCVCMIVYKDICTHMYMCVYIMFKLWNHSNDIMSSVIRIYTFKIIEEYMVNLF